MKNLVAILMLMICFPAFSYTLEDTSKKENFENVSCYEINEIATIYLDSIKKMIPFDDGFLLDNIYDLSDNSGQRTLKKATFLYVKKQRVKGKLHCKSNINFKSNYRKIHLNNVKKPPLSLKSYYINLKKVNFNKHFIKSFPKHQFTELHRFRNDFLMFEKKL